MPYIGNQPAESFTSFATQEFSTSATTSYTLDHAVTNENEIALFINNVRQQPGSGKAYTATGTALTLSAATASTDTMYCVFLGRALQTVNPAGGSIGSSQLSADAITGQTALTSAPDSTDELLISDAGTLKRIDVSLVGGANTPYFQAVQSTDVSLTDNTATLIPFNQDPFDSGSLFNTSNGRFVMDSANAGKYFIYCKVSIDADTNFSSTGNFLELQLRHYNSSDSQLFSHSSRNGFSNIDDPTVQVSGFFSLANGDYVVPYVKVTASGLNAFGVNTTSPSKLEFTGFKIIE